MNQYPTTRTILGTLLGFSAAAAKILTPDQADLHETQTREAKLAQIAEQRDTFLRQVARAKRVYARGGLPAAKTPTTQVDHDAIERAKNKRLRRANRWMSFCLHRDASASA